MSPRTPEPPGPALAALGALLDRSVLLIAEAARDARTFDRETVRAVADMWDNTTLPLFRAATGGSGGTRERRALAALEWMQRLRPGRWDWMVEQGAADGHRIDTLIRPVPDRSDTPFRDYRGVVRPAYSRWTPGTLSELAADYALEEGTVRQVHLERTGTRLCGFLAVDLVRSYRPGDDASPEPPALHVYLEDVTEADVDTAAAPGVRLESTPGGMAIGLGTHGVLRARSASLGLRDGTWHLSGAGRRADALVPPPPPREVAGAPEEGELDGSTRGAADFVRWALLLIRSVRHPLEVARVPLQAYCRALEGAGGDILAAGALPGREREAAFRSLVATWLRRGGAEPASDWKPLLQSVPNARELARGVRGEPAEEGALPPVPARRLTDGPGRAELRMVSYTAGRTAAGRRRAASAVAHLAVPGADENAPWRMEVLQAADPVRLRVRAEAFAGAGRAGIDRDGDEGETLVAEGGTLALGARAWSPVT